MLFWLLKDAWLTCNRCSISVLLTPFWSPIKHLLRTTWQPVDWLLVTSLLFARVLYICRWSVWNYVMTFQNVICISNELKRKGLCLGGRWQNRRLTVLAMFVVNESSWFSRQSYTKSIHAFNGRILFWWMQYSGQTSNLKSQISNLNPQTSKFCHVRNKM